MARTPFELKGKTVYVAGHRGMVGSALVRRLAREDVALVTVPRSALRREDGETFVAVRTADGWRKAPVQLGIATAQHVEIVAGLEEGTAVLSNQEN